MKTNQFIILVAVILITILGCFWIYQYNENQKYNTEKDLQCQERFKDYEDELNAVYDRTYEVEQIKWSWDNCIAYVHSYWWAWEEVSIDFLIHSHDLYYENHCTESSFDSHENYLKCSKKLKRKFKSF